MSTTENKILSGKCGTWLPVPKGLTGKQVAAFYKEHGIGIYLVSDIREWVKNKKPPRKYKDIPKRDFPTLAEAELRKNEIHE